MTHSSCRRAFCSTFTSADPGGGTRPACLARGRAQGEAGGRDPRRKSRDRRRNEFLFFASLFLAEDGERGKSEKKNPKQRRHSSKNLLLFARTFYLFVPFLFFSPLRKVRSLCRADSPPFFTRMIHLRIVRARGRGLSRGAPWREIERGLSLDRGCATLSSSWIRAFPRPAIFSPLCVLFRCADRANCDS